MRILGVSGSLRHASHNTALLHAAAALTPEGVTFQLFEGLRDVPPYDADDDHDPAPAGAAAFRTALAEADAVLFATPEYNASIPGVLKNAIDWASRPFPDNALKGRPVAVVGATTGSFGAVWAQAELRKVLSTAGARVLEEGVALAKAHEQFDEQGGLVSGDLLGKLEVVIAVLVKEAEVSASFTS